MKTSSFDSTIRIPSSLRCCSSQSVSTSASGCAYCVGVVAIGQEISVRLSIQATTKLLGGVLRIFHLFTNRGENLSDSDFACGVGDERRQLAAAVGINGIGGASFVCTRRLEQPSALTQFHSQYARLLRRTELIRGLPTVLINQAAAFSRPRFLVDTQSIITVAHDLWRKALISDHGVAFPFYETALGGEGHELWILLEIIEDVVHRASGRIDLADCFVFFQRRSRARAAIEHDAPALARQFPIIVGLARKIRFRGKGAPSGREHQKQEQTSPRHSAILAEVTPGRSDNFTRCQSGS